MNENPAQKVEMTVQIQWWPGADTANKVRGAISVIFSSQVSLHFHHCKRDEVYFTTLLWQNNGRQNDLISRMPFSELYKIMVNKVTSVGFRAAIAPVALPWIRPDSDVWFWLRKHFGKIIRRMMFEIIRFEILRETKSQLISQCNNLEYRNDQI